MHRVLSVGQCGYDHRRLATQLQRDFDAIVDPAETFDEALSSLRRETYHLILVNRVTDADGTRGIDLIKSLRDDPSFTRIPIMLVSNLAEAQGEAERHGALPGFGKSDLGTLGAVERLAPILGIEPS
jgi:two-component system chemotaxis response regulator CheY